MLRKHCFLLLAEAACNKKEKISPRSIVRSLCFSATLVAILSGCGGSRSETAGTAAARQLLTDNVTRVLDQGILTAASPGNFYIAVNSKGYDVELRPVTLGNGYRDGLDILAVGNTTDGLAIGPGFSGSPLMRVAGDDKSIWGPLFAGYDGANTQFVAHTLAPMLEIDRSATPVTRASGVSSPKHSLLAYLVGGISNERFQGFVQRDPRGVLEKFTVNDRSGSGRSRATIPPPIGGRSLSVNLLRGDVLSIYAVGSFTYYDENKQRWVVFGHPLDWVGRRSLPVSMAYVDDIITEYGGYSFKMARPVGPDLGILDNDRYAGCSVVWNDGDNRAKTTPLTTNFYPQNSDKAITYKHNLAQMESIHDQFVYASYGVSAPCDRGRDRVGGGSARVGLVIRGNGDPKPIVIIETITDEYDLTYAVFYWAIDKLEGLLTDADGNPKPFTLDSLRLDMHEL